MSSTGQSIEVYTGGSLEARRAVVTAREAGAWLRNLLTELDDLRAANNTDLWGLTHLRHILSPLKKDLAILLRKIEDDQANNGGLTRNVPAEVEGVGLVTLMGGSERVWMISQDDIAEAVIQWALFDPETGEVFDAQSAAERAVKACRALWVVPSDQPKVGGLKLIGLDPNAGQKPDDPREPIMEWVDKQASVKMEAAK